MHYTQTIRSHIQGGILALSAFLLCIASQAQSEFIWRDPVESTIAVIEGQAWNGETEDPYDRLPMRARETVRQPVWNLSKHAAGLMISFKSDADRIVVRYAVTKSLAMEHMPATGVSGVDLYSIDQQGHWNWARGIRKFADTISYDFQGLPGNEREYRLYLPLYNQVKWMEIGVATTDNFEFLPVRQEKPILVYGTSIAQGGCASRPGMGWTNIVNRMVDAPMINLAFSGNGRLEPELIDLLAEIEARLYVLDCLPNLTNAGQYPAQELTKRINHAVSTLKQRRPGIPILLVEHAGYSDGPIQNTREQAYQRVNRIQRQVFEKLISQGVEDLYYLSHREINLQLDDTVDGTHPNDLGMMHYAEAYGQRLEEILD